MKNDESDFERKVKIIYKIIDSNKYNYLKLFLDGLKYYKLNENNEPIFTPYQDKMWST